VPNISDVVVVEKVIEHRKTKHCVCILVATDKYLMINTSHRDIYDDFEIESSEYVFLKSINRFVCCSEMFYVSPDKILRSVGNLNRNDMLKIVNKIQNSKIMGDIEKDSVLPELRKWLLDLP